MPGRLLPTLLLASLVGLAFAREAPASTLIFADDTFEGADWSFQLFNFHTGGTATPSQPLGGGNPGAYQEVAYATNLATDPADNAAIYVFHAFAGAVVDPASDGAIASVDYFWDVRAVSGGGTFSGPALMQGGNVYVSAGLLELTGTGTTWRSVSRVGVLDVNYGRIQDVLEIDPAQDPDFSASGAPITFGYFSALAGALGGPAAGATAGFDNWSVDVHLVPEPRLAALLVLAGVHAARRGRRRGRAR
jgi:hypothetical protein